MKSKYQKYLNSGHWKNLRNEAFEFYGKQCSICFNNKNIRVHHIFYREGTPLTCLKEDLRIVCQRCHDEIHRHDKFFISTKDINVAYEKWNHAVQILGSIFSNEQTENTQNIGKITLNQNPMLPPLSKPLSWRSYFLQKYGKNAWRKYRRFYRKDKSTFHTRERIEYQNYKKDFSLLSRNP